MTAPGHTCVQIPIAGLVDLALTSPAFTDLIDRARDRPDSLARSGPASARLFVAAALARTGPLLVVTATGREADDLTAELKAVLRRRGRVQFPSWRRCRTSALTRVETVGGPDAGAAPAGPPRDEHWARRCRWSSPPPARCCSRGPRPARSNPSRWPSAPNPTSTTPSPRLVELATPGSTWWPSAVEFAVRGGILDLSPADRRTPCCAWSSGATNSPRCGCSRGRSALHPGDRGHPGWTPCRAWRS